MEIYRVLEKVKENIESGEGYLQAGICHNAKEICWDVYDTGEARYVIYNLKIILEDYCSSWDKFSGSLIYPIKAEYEDGYTAYNTTINKWDKSTQYGRERWELLEGLINYCKEKDI